MDIGMHFKHLREQKNLSREQVSEELGISLGTYKKIEYGSRQPSVIETNKFAEIVDVDPSVFFHKSSSNVTNNGNYHAGKGNIIINEKELIMSLIASLDKISGVLTRIVDNMEKPENKRG